MTEVYTFKPAPALFLAKTSYHQPTNFTWFSSWMQNSAEQPPILSHWGLRHQFRDLFGFSSKSSV